VLATATAAVSLTFTTIGKKAETQTATVSITTAKQRYEVPLNVKGNAVQIEASVTGACPDIYYLGVETDEASAQ
jgi:hypothetical protein